MFKVANDCGGNDVRYGFDLRSIITRRCTTAALIGSYTWRSCAAFEKLKINVSQDFKYPAAFGLIIEGTKKRLRYLLIKAKKIVTLRRVTEIQLSYNTTEPLSYMMVY